jgi:hypothetical protein
MFLIYFPEFISKEVILKFIISLINLNVC